MTPLIEHVYKTTEDVSLRGRAALTLAFDALSNNAYDDAMGYADEAIQEGYFQAVDTLVAAAQKTGKLNAGELDGTPEQQKMYLAGRVYDQGIGVQEDPMIAENFYVKAAGLDGEEEQGSAQALQMLTHRNLEAGNYEFAAQACQRLVKQGHEEFRLPLLRLHALGLAKQAPNIPATTKNADEMLVVCQQRVETNKLTSAVFTYRRAVKQGSAQAAARLMRLEGERRLPKSDSIKPEEVVAFSQMIGEAQQKLDAELAKAAQAPDTNVLTAYEVLQKAVDLRMGEGYVKSEALNELSGQEELPVEDFLIHVTDNEQQQAENTVALLRQVYTAPSKKAKNEALKIGAQLLLGVDQPEESHKLLVEKLLTHTTHTTHTTWEGPQDLIQQKRWAFVDTVMRSLDSYVNEATAEESEGIFRLSPATADADALQKKIIQNDAESLSKEVTIEDKEAAILFSSVMKKELEQMHLVPEDQRQDWIDLAELSERMNLGEPALQQELQEKIAQLPQDNREMFMRIISWSRNFSKSEKTKMNASNLARMFGPRIFPPPQAGPEQMMKYTKYGNKILQVLLTPPVASDVL